MVDLMRRPGQEEPTPPPTTRRVVRPAAILLGVLSVILLALITPYNDYQLKNTFLYGNHFPLGGVFLFTVMVLGVNTLLRHRWPRLALNREELLTYWCMLLAGGGLASSGLMRYLGPLPVAPFYYQTPQNHWELIASKIPAWLVPSTDPNSLVVRGFFDGISPHLPVPWMPWVKVLVAWGVLFLLLFAATICLSTLIRRQWVDNERLLFPLVILPVEMAREPEPGRLLNAFFRSPVMWIGFALPVIIHGLNGLHAYFVSVPEVPRMFRVVLTKKPWWAMGIWSVEYYLCVIGLAFLLSTEISFSLWAFWLMSRLARAVRVQLAMDPLSPTTPNHEVSIAFGCYIAWGLVMIWLARPHLRAVFRKAFYGDPSVDDSKEPLSYRVAVFGGLLSFAGIVAWSWAAGMSPGIAALTFGIFLLTLLILSRVIAEGGVLFVQSQFVPSDFILLGTGSAAYNAPTWAIGQLQQVIFMHDPREALMPNVMNAYRIREGSRLLSRTILGAIVLAVVVGLVVSFFAFITTAYRYGGTGLDPWGMVNAPRSYIDRAVKNLEQPVLPMQPALWNVVLGLGMGLAAFYMRLNYLWWPLHPIGLVTMPSYAMGTLAFSVFIAWGLKVLIMRFGGLKGFQVALPFFLGMVLGDGFIAGVWAIVGIITGVGVPRFLPG